MEVTDVKIAVPLHNVIITHKVAQTGSSLVVEVGPGGMMLAGVTLSVVLSLSPGILSPDVKTVSSFGRWVSRIALIATTSMTIYGGLRLAGRISPSV